VGGVAEVSVASGTKKLFLYISTLQKELKNSGVDFLNKNPYRVHLNGG